MKLIMPGAGKASVRNAEVQRAWVSRPSQNALSKGSNKKVTMPGSKEHRYAETTPPAIGAANQWIKTVFDPAHARSYGCIGAPDNNKLPTVVATGKDTITISDRTFPISTLQYPVWYMKTDGGILASTSSTTVNARDETKNERISIYSHPIFGNLIISKMSSTVEISGGNYSYWIMHLVAVANTQQNNRTISMAHVVENVGDWGNMGGYFTAGHLPMAVEYDNDVSDRDFMINAEQQESFTTYTAGSAAGVYNICRIRNLDQAMFFNPGIENGVVRIKTQDGTIASNSIALNGMYDAPYGSWDMSCTTYFATSTSFTLRLTFYHNIEFVLPYSVGGSDGARYDRAALEFVMAMFDQHDFIFPADHNDGKKLAKTVRKMLIRYRAPILAAMGVSNAPLWLKAATKGIYAGLDAMN